MNVTRDQFKTLKEALKLIPVNSLSGKDKMLYRDAAATIKTLEEKQQRDNARTWNYIRNKRKSDPDYCRPQKEHKKRSG